MRTKSGRQFQNGTHRSIFFGDLRLQKPAKDNSRRGNMHRELLIFGHKLLTAPYGKAATKFRMNVSCGPPFRVFCVFRVSAPPR